MIPLPFTRELPDFTRIQWNSAQARSVWEPRIAAITRAWLDIERLSVLEGVRPSALMNIAPEELALASAWAAARSLVLLPLSRVSETPQYAATQQEAGAGEPFAYRCVLTGPALATEWVRAWEAHDDEAIGTLLGYPPCCRAHFAETWGKGSVDPTWAMERQDAVERDVRPENNILLRWLGVRAVPSLPCSFDCEPTYELGQKLLALGEKHGHLLAVGWIREMLAWPVEWSALHGIAEIKTPILKIIARTDATADKLVVRLKGTEYPAEGSTGTVFPYREKRGAKLTESKPFQTIVQLHDARLWKDNGFATREAMEAAHQTLEAAFYGLGLQQAEAPIRIMDLGSGNGELLRRLGKTLNAPILEGVELDADRARRGRRRGLVTIREGDFLAETGLWDGWYDVLVLMPGRLVEAPDKAERIRTLLSQRATMLLLYAYGDVLERHGSLPALCRDAGLPVPRSLITMQGCSAGTVSTVVDRVRR